MPEDQTTSFSTSGEEAITQVIDIQPDNSANTLSPKEFDDFYEIERTADEIIEGDYKRIALQFPDELLHDSVPIFRRLKRRIGLGRELYVLADTSYGRQACNCCVDEVAASHADADAMVHYGHACMSQTSRLPVVYVFGKKHLDIEDCCNQLSKMLDETTKNPSHILLKTDVVFSHYAHLIRRRLEEQLPANTSVLYHDLPFKTNPASARLRLDSVSTHDLPSEHTVIFYIGGESMHLTNLLMTNNSIQIFSYNPQSKTARLESDRTNRLVMRRYAMLQKARDADVFGILVGTLGVASYLSLIKHIRGLLAQKQKKSYTISVGKLNPAKLANFLEIECFVLVACPENSVIDSKDFLRPIITPYELEVALQAEPSWTGRYVLNFGQLLSEADSTATDEVNEEDSDQPVFSLVSGTYRHAKRYTTKDKATNGTTPEESSALILRNQESTVAKFGGDNAAGQFLQQRSYQGLEVNWGGDEPSQLEQGRTGLARGYQDDRTHQDY